MNGVALAFLVSVGCLVVSPLLLRSSRRFDGCPRIGLTVWGALVAIGWLSSIVFFLRVGLGKPTGSIVASFGTFLGGLGDGHPLRGAGFREVVGLSMALDIAIVLVASLVRTAVAIAVNRRRHRALVDMVAFRTDRPADVSVLAHAQPLAYFLPGRGGRVVVTQGAVDALSPAELEAVISHERGHRHGHHGAWLVSLQSLSPFVQFVPLARFAPSVMRMYLEMSADDYARDRVPLGALEGALGKLPLFGVAPLGAMGLTNDFAERRLARLGTGSTLVRDAAVAIAIVSASLSFLWFVSLGHF